MAIKKAETEKITISLVSSIVANPEKWMIKTITTMGRVEINADLNLLSQLKDINIHLSFLKY
jgi:hypothetical protein